MENIAAVYGGGRKAFLIDYIAWSTCAGAYKYQDNLFQLFCYLLLEYKEYRNIFSYRIENKYLHKIFDILFPGVDSIMILMPKGRIGSNFQFGHRTSIVVYAESIGNNVCIYQQTTIGTGKTGIPTIGDNVMVYSGAKIFGNIKIGNGSTVGANAVVTKDVPENAIVAGVPAKIIGWNK